MKHSKGWIVTAAAGAAVGAVAAAGATSPDWAQYATSLQILSLIGFVVAVTGLTRSFTDFQERAVNPVRKENRR